MSGSIWAALSINCIKLHNRIVDHEFVISHRNIDIASHHGLWHNDLAPGQSGRGEPIAQT
jgi:hypothetical protein